MTRKFKTALQIIGFGLNIRAVQSLYLEEMMKEVETTSSVEALFTEQRRAWRFWLQLCGLITGFIGYFLRDHHAVPGAILMYIGVLLVAIQINSKWMPTPLEATNANLKVEK